MTDSAKVLIYSRDPGPANVMIAVYEALSSAPILAECSAEFGRFAQRVCPGGSCEYLICAKDPALGRWRQAGHAVADWHTLVPETAEDDGLDNAIGTMLRAERITAIVTGASDIDDDTDRALWRVARILDLPSFAFIDHPANLARRFVERDGTVSRPGAVMVPDESYAREILTAGVPAERVHVVEDLHIARVCRLESQIGEPEIAALREKWGAAPTDDIVVFASECTSEMEEKGRSSPYSEFESLEGLIAKIARREPVGDRLFEPDRTLLIVRPHPKDSDGKYDRHTRPSRPRVVVSSEGNSMTAILAAHFVAGMDSQMLREAEALGRKVICLVDTGSFADRRTAEHGG